MEMRNGVLTSKKISFLMNFQQFIWRVYVVENSIFFEHIKNISFILDFF